MKTSALKRQQGAARSNTHYQKNKEAISLKNKNDRASIKNHRNPPVAMKTQQEPEIQQEPLPEQPVIWNLAKLVEKLKVRANVENATRKNDVSTITRLCKDRKSVV